MFRRLPDDERDRVVLTFEDERIEARRGDTLAAALLAHGRMVTRETAGGGRGPFCMMGVCFECLVDVHGRGGGRGLQACMIEVCDGMKAGRHRTQSSDEPEGAA
ncbi:MAG: (2Fe-2S)-binding protein [Geminicoccaceae bacterium]|nr:(2Fe-2S)-binding protein [Geminicoccaceae bacterium]